MRVDDTDLTVRPIAIADVERLARLFTRLSPDERPLPLLLADLAGRPRAALLRLADVDHDRRDALVALDGDEIVAVARYDGRPGQPDEAEIAITVEDAWQHRGVGKRLAVRLAGARDRARLRHVRRDDAARQPGRARARAQARRPTPRCAGPAASTKPTLPLRHAS